MRINKYLAMGTLALAIGAPTIASAQIVPGEDYVHPHHCHKIPPFSKMIAKEHKVAFKDFMNETNQHLMPLLKEKQALNMQLGGLLATPGIQWEDISKIVEKINSNDAKMTTLFAKTQLDVVKKFGVVLPPSPIAPIPMLSI